MFDIGLGEIIALAAIALLVFGPDQLPKAASSAGRMVRQVREMASSARKELGDSVELDSITDDLKSLSELHPKRLLSSALSDDDQPTDEAKATRSNGKSSATSTAASASPATEVGSAASQPSVGQVNGAQPAPVSGDGAADPGAKAPKAVARKQPAGDFDPDAT